MASHSFRFAVTPEDPEKMAAERTMRLKAVVFDLDDTLVLSTIDFGKFKRLVIERLAKWGEPKGLYSPNETIVSILKRYEDRARESGVGEKELRNRFEELDQIMNSVELERVSDTVPIRGAAELLGLLRARGIRIGVLTRGCHEYATQALSITRLDGLVDKIECRNSNSKAKPDPEAYLRLVANLGVRPDETLFVGDHPIDAQCASNAGVPFVAVKTGDVPEEDLRAAGSLEVFEDVGQMVDWLVSRLRD